MIWGTKWLALWGVCLALLSLAAMMDERLTWGIAVRVLIQVVLLALWLRQYTGGK